MSSTPRGVAARSDIEDACRQLETKIETTAANLKVDALRWLIVSEVALGGWLFATFKFIWGNRIGG